MTDLSAEERANRFIQFCVKALVEGMMNWNIAEETLIREIREAEDAALERACQELREAMGYGVEFNKHMDYAIEVMNRLKHGGAND